MQTQFDTPIIPPHLQMGNNQSEVIVERVEDKSMKAVFFPGDVITLAEKEAVMFRLGGRVYDKMLTLPNNLVTRCAITALRQGMMSIHKNLIDPKEHKNYVQSYTATNVWNPAKGRFENVRVGVDRFGNSLNLVYKPIYPIQEVGQIANRGDGTVVIPHVKTPDDIKEAQLFYFPDWIKIVTGQTVLPEVLRALEDEMANRRAKAQSRELREIGDAMLVSCQQYRLWGKAYVDFQTAKIKGAEKVVDVHQRYDEISERLFIALEITRQDSLITDFARTQNKQTEDSSDIKTAISLLAKLVAEKEAASGSLLKAKPQAEAPPSGKTDKQISPPAFSDLQSEITDTEEVSDDAQTGTGDGITGDTANGETTDKTTPKSPAASRTPKPPKAS